MNPVRLAILACLSLVFLVALPFGLVCAGRALDPFTPQPESALKPPFYVYSPSDYYTPSSNNSSSPANPTPSAKSTSGPIYYDYSSPSYYTWAGSDELGRFLSARLLLAGGLSLGAASMALVLALALAMILGGLSGWYHGQWPDRVISWLIALLHTVPFFLLVVVAAAIWRPGFFGAFVIVGLCAWAAPARLARAEFIRLRNARHVLAARAFGFPAHTIMLRQTLPVAFLPAFTAVLLLMPELIGLDVGLGFFGLGAQPPTPTLGRLLYAGLSRLNAAPWLGFAPCLMVILLSLAAFGLAALWSRSIPVSSRA